MAAFGAPSAFGAPAAFGAPQQVGAFGAVGGMGGQLARYKCDDKDVDIVQPPADSVSSLAWSPVANHLIASSWDNSLSCWEVIPQGLQSQPKARIQADAPPLCTAFAPDGSSVYFGGCDNKAFVWNLATQQKTQVGQHTAPIRHCAFIPEINMLVTGGWDAKLNYWDTRQPNPAMTVSLPERCYALAVGHPVLVAACAEKHILVYNLTNPQTPYKHLGPAGQEAQSPLKHQIRCAAVFPDRTGFLVGSIEGRVAVQHVEAHNSSKNFTFKCHRHGSDIYAVNSLSFHPTHGTFLTAGADGTYNFWDKDSKQRLRAMNPAAGQNQAGVLPVTECRFNHDGTVVAYSTCYDWSRGHAEHNPQTAKTHILLHESLDTEVKGRGRQNRR